MTQAGAKKALGIFFILLPFFVIFYFAADLLGIWKALIIYAESIGAIFAIIIGIYLMEVE